MKWLRSLIGLGLLLIVSAFLPQEWVQSAGLDVWNMPKLHAEIVQCQQQSQAMDEEARVLTQRIAVKDQLVKELVEGRADFKKVTDQFAALNSDDPEVIVHLRDYYHVSNERELAALNVLAFAETYLDADGQQAKKPAVMRRLDREFDAMFPEE